MKRVLWAWETDTIVSIKLSFHECQQNQVAECWPQKEAAVTVPHRGDSGSTQWS